MVGSLQTEVGMSNFTYFKSNLKLMSTSTFNQMYSKKNYEYEYQLFNPQLCTGIFDFFFRVRVRGLYIKNTHKYMYSNAFGTQSTFLSAYYHG